MMFTDNYNKYCSDAKAIKQLVHSLANKSER